MSTTRFMVDCRKAPSDSHCSLAIAGTREEVLNASVEHAVAVHGHARSPELRGQIQSFLEEDRAGGVQERNRELAQRLYAAFNQHDFDTIEQLIDPRGKMLNVATSESFAGPKGFRSYCEGWARAFPDARVDIERILAGPEGFSCEFTGSGTHKGPLAGPMGTLPPTGKRIRQRFVEVLAVRDGKVLDGRLYFDLTSMMAQLGMAAPMRPAQAEPADQAARH